MNSNTNAVQAIIADIKALEEFRTRAGMSGDQAVNVYRAVKVDEVIGTRELAREAGCSPASVTAWVGAGWIIDRLEGLADAYVGSPLEVRSLAVAVGNRAIADADTESDTAEEFWRHLTRAKVAKVAAKAAKEEEAKEEPAKATKVAKVAEPVDLWTKALEAVTAALESMEPGNTTDEVISLVDKVGAVAVLALQNADKARQNLEPAEVVQTSAGRGDIVTAGR
jgi:hypothetical protein